jgi:hypothetical protein
MFDLQARGFSCDADLDHRRKSGSIGAVVDEAIAATFEYLINPHAADEIIAPLRSGEARIRFNLGMRKAAMK